MTNIEKTLTMLEDIVVTAETVEYHRNKNPKRFELELNNLKSQTEQWRTWCKQSDEITPL